MIRLDITNGILSGKEVINSQKKLGDLKHVFMDESAREMMDQNDIIYQVQAWMPVKEGKSGGLFFGNSMISPGQVGEEYFMTRGHFHANIDTAEYYWCVQGEGALILMDLDRRCWFEEMTPGSVHYIPGKVAHRVANTGSENLVFNACWPSDAEHDYQSIEKDAFRLNYFTFSAT